MKAKLIKTIDEQGVMYSLSGDNLPENYVLSLKNCQAIERGYDLDELAIKSSKEYFIKPIEAPIFTFGYEAGFQKALEIFSDKKYTEKDLDRAVSQGIVKGRLGIDAFLQSLQPTEWDVEILEIENDEVYSVSENMKVAHNKAFDGVLFKHDVDDCLILKRK